MKTTMSRMNILQERGEQQFRYCIKNIGQLEDVAIEAIQRILREKNISKLWDNLKQT